MTRYCDSITCFLKSIYRNVLKFITIIKEFNNTFSIRSRNSYKNVTKTWNY